MGIGSLQKALAMQCGGILHLTQDELTIIVFVEIIDVQYNA